MPGISPACAMPRRHTRHKPNLRYTDRARPHLRQRLYPRTLYFGLAFALLINDFFATSMPFRYFFFAAGLPAAPLPRNAGPRRLILSVVAASVSSRLNGK